MKKVVTVCNSSCQGKHLENSSVHLGEIDYTFFTGPQRNEETKMNSIHSDSRVPLQVRMDLANAALAYADALVVSGAVGINNAKMDLNNAVEDCRICIKAYEMGMS